MIKVKNLSLIHSSGKEVLDVSFNVAKSQVLALIGKNNSSKDVIARVVADPAIDHDGEIIINHVNRQHEKHRIHHHVGYCAELPDLEDHLTGYEYLDFIATAMQVGANDRSKEIIKLSKQWGVEKDIYRQIELLDPNTKKKVSLIASILHAPAAVIWDNPTTLLDPTEKQMVYDQISELKHQKTSILISSNDLELVENVADEIAVVKDGSIIMSGNLTQLKNQAGSKTKSLSEIFEEAHKNA